MLVADKKWCTNFQIFHINLDSSCRGRHFAEFRCMKYKKILSKLRWFGKTFESLIKISHTCTLHARPLVRSKWFYIENAIRSLGVQSDCIEFEFCWLFKREKKKVFFLYKFPNTSSIFYTNCCPSFQTNCSTANLLLFDQEPNIERIYFDRMISIMRFFFSWKQ